MAATLRRFVVDFFNAHDPAVGREIMVDDYVLTVGRHVLRGRDATYLPAVSAQMAQFPGLGMTVHDLVTAPGRAALVFTEHGRSGGVGGPVACWSGVALYRHDGVRLSACFATEDYHARRRQLKGSPPDPVAAPAPAPWDGSVGRPDPTIEAVVRCWLAESAAAADPAVTYDDESLGVGPRLEFAVAGVEVTELFSAGDQVAFAVVHRGTYRGGLGVPAQPDLYELASAGVVTVTDGRVVDGRVVRDRAGLALALTDQISRRRRSHG